MVNGVGGGEYMNFEMFLFDQGIYFVLSLVFKILIEKVRGLL